MLKKRGMKEEFKMVERPQIRRMGGSVGSVEKVSSREENADNCTSTIVICSTIFKH